VQSEKRLVSGYAFRRADTAARFEAGVTGCGKLLRGAGIPSAAKAVIYSTRPTVRLEAAPFQNKSKKKRGLYRSAGSAAPPKSNFFLQTVKPIVDFDGIAEARP
jgi:hypothetical protein